MKTKKLRIATLFILLLGVCLVGCAPEITPPDSSDGEDLSNEVERATPTTESVLERVETPVQAELTIAETAVPEDYPAPTAVPDNGYPIGTPVPTYDPYAAPDETADTTTGDVVSEADADVTFVRVVSEGDDKWTFHVTVAHPDTGDADYADGWDVITPDNVVLKANLDDMFTRLLTHPHIDEQPFTRSQSGIVVPAEVTGVFVRAHDIVHGWGGNMVFVDFTQDEGPNYVIER